jgi:hypothetical protein
MKRTTTILLISALLGSGSVAAADWVVKPVQGASGQASKCIMESDKKEIFDGYQNIAIYIVVDGASVAVKSASVLDPGFSDIGMHVDKDAFIAMDKVIQDKTASFDSNYAIIVEEFKRGLKVNVQLRFWPTWPVTGTHSATLSLIGFTKGFTEMSDCK